MEYSPKQDQRRRLEQILGCYQYTENATSDVSLRIFDVLNEIAVKVAEGQRRPVGIGIALGYTPTNYKHARDMDENYFAGQRCSIYDDDIADKIADASERYDGGILIDWEGNVLKGGVKFIADDYDVLEEMGIPNNRGLSERFGFEEKVGTRHTSSIAASYRMPNTFVYVMSEESGKVRVFKEGYIISSPHQKEISWPVMRVVPEEDERPAAEDSLQVA